MPGRVRITSETVEFIDHWPVRELGNSRLIRVTILCGDVNRSKIEGQQVVQKVKFDPWLWTGQHS